MSLLISTKYLHKAIQKNDDTIIVDTRSFLEYKNGLVPGAVNIDLFQLYWFDTTKRGIKDFNRQTRLMLSNIGNSNVYLKSSSTPILWLTLTQLKMATDY